MDSTLNPSAKSSSSSSFAPRPSNYLRSLQENYRLFEEEEKNNNRMSSTTPNRHLNKGRDALFPNHNEWKWLCDRCNLLNPPPNSPLLVYGACPSCKTTRGRSDKIIWERSTSSHPAQPPRYDHTPEPVFRGSEAAIRANNQLLDHGHDGWLRPGEWLRGGGGDGYGAGGGRAVDGIESAREKERERKRDRGREEEEIWEEQEKQRQERKAEKEYEEREIMREKTGGRAHMKLTAYPMGGKRRQARW